MSKNEMAAVPPDQPARDAIVQLLDTTMLVEASAGTGKTRSMVDRMIALLREGKCNISTLAAITFTRKAAAELRARFQIALEKAVRQAEGEVCQRLTDALDHAERAYIGTIHSFCGRLLRDALLRLASILHLGSSTRPWTSGCESRHGSSTSLG